MHFAHHRPIVIVAIAALLVSCGGSDTQRPVVAPPSTSQIRPSVPPIETLPDPDATDASVEASDDVVDPAEGQPLPTDAIADEVEVTGFPALNDPDAFCRNYALMTQSVYVVGLTGSEGDPELVPRGEVVGAFTFLQGVEGLNGPWPEGLDSERPTLTAQYAGYVTRAQKAVELLRDAGLDEVALQRIDADWRDVMSALPIGSPLDDVPVNPADAAAVDAVVERFIDSLPAKADDPAIAASDDAPATPLVDEWTAANCAGPEIDDGSDDDVDLGESTDG